MVKSFALSDRDEVAATKNDIAIYSVSKIEMKKKNPKKNEAGKRGHTKYRNKKREREMENCELTRIRKGEW